MGNLRIKNPVKADADFRAKFSDKVDEWFHKFLKQNPGEKVIIEMYGPLPASLLGREKQVSQDGISKYDEETDPDTFICFINGEEITYDIWRMLIGISKQEMWRDHVTHIRKTTPSRDRMKQLMVADPKDLKPTQIEYPSDAVLVDELTREQVGVDRGQAETQEIDALDDAELEDA